MTIGSSYKAMDCCSQKKAGRKRPWNHLFWYTPLKEVGVASVKISKSAASVTLSSKKTEAPFTVWETESTCGGLSAWLLSMLHDGVAQWLFLTEKSNATQTSGLGEWLCWQSSYGGWAKVALFWYTFSDRVKVRICLTFAGGSLGGVSLRFS